MNLQQFKESLSQNTPPTGLSNALQALWQMGKGDWKAAHVLAQAQDDVSGAWVHAYLHRQEGDDTNAAYWYSRANQPVAQQDLEKEWEEIAQSLLD